MTKAKNDVILNSREFFPTRRQSIVSKVVGLLLLASPAILNTVGFFEARYHIRTLGSVEAALEHDEDSKVYTSPTAESLEGMFFRIGKNIAYKLYSDN